MPGAYVEDQTPLLAVNVSDTDIVYVGIPGDADPDRKMTMTELRAYLDGYFALLTGATFSGDITRSAATDVFTTIQGGSIEVASNSPYPFIDLKDAAADDFDVRLYLSGGDLKVTGGGIRLSGTDGLDFSGAGTAAETLDDYEEGTWTPTFVTGYGVWSAATGITVNDARYTRVGEVVTIWGEIVFTGLTTAAYTAASAQMGGLPFASWATTDGWLTIGNAWARKAVSGSSGTFFHIATDNAGVTDWRFAMVGNAPNGGDDNDQPVTFFGTYRTTA